MGFYEAYYLKYKNFSYENYFNQLQPTDVLRVIEKRKLSELDFLTLLSPKAGEYLEEMAVKARQLSLQHFGKSILLYTPMYLGNYCVNRCAYCSYNIDHKITRKKLTFEEIEKEAKAIAATGLRHILLLTGESKKETPLSYLMEAVRIIKKHFESVGIEIYPLTEVEYQKVIDAGVDGVTVYQEVYDEDIYDRVHLSGPKKKYHFRLDTPERACKAKMRSVNIGALLGLNEWQSEAFMTGLHGNYLQNKFSDVEMSISLPRIRPHIGAFQDVHPVSDKALVQILLALRIYLPYIGITMSTRESQAFRDHLIPLGITKMSAGVTTAVGGHTSENKGEQQFEISDSRNVAQVRQAIIEKGYHPIFKNWMQLAN